MHRIIRRAITAVSGVCFAFGLTVSAPALAQQVPTYLGNMDFVGFNYAPRGWAQCDGQLLAINNNQALFSLLGTTFGGDGRTSFALPDLRGRSPIHGGGGTNGLGAKGGMETVFLTVAQLPSHTHTLRATNAAGTSTMPTGNTLANDDPDETYVNQAPNVDMHGGALGPTQSLGHDNMSPFLAVNCIIALAGNFPSRN